MNEIKKTNIADVAPYAGPHAIEGIRFRSVRPAVGVTAWGMNVIEIDPHCDLYPEHDHREDRQEEVYVILDGKAELHTNAGVTSLQKGDLIRVAPEVKRAIVTKEHAVTVLALGGTPGQAYSPSDL